MEWPVEKYTNIVSVLAEVGIDNNNNEIKLPKIELEWMMACTKVKWINPIRRDRNV